MGFFDRLFSIARRERVYDDCDFYESANQGEHIGLFFAWALLRNLHDPEWREAAAQLAERAVARAAPLKPTRLLDDKKLATTSLNDEGNAFAGAYYDAYLDDFDETLDDETVAEGSWAHFDVVAELLDGRYAAWVAEGRKQRAPKGGRLVRPARPVVSSDDALAALKALDRLRAGRRSFSAPAGRVLKALNQRAPDEALRAALLEQAERGKWPSATTSVRALIARFDRETVVEALLRLEFKGKGRWPKLETCPELLRDLARARQWRAEPDLQAGVQRCVARDFAAVCHLQLAELLAGPEVKARLRQAYITGALARPELPPYLADYICRFKLEPEQRAKVALPACGFRVRQLDVRRQFDSDFPALLKDLDALEKGGLSLADGEGRALVELLQTRFQEWTQLLPQLEVPYGDPQQDLLHALEGLFIDGPSNVAARPELRRLWREVLLFDSQRANESFAMNLQYEIERLDKLAQKGMSLDDGDGRALVELLRAHWQRWLGALPTFETPVRDARLVLRKLHPFFADDERSVLKRPEFQPLWRELVAFLVPDPAQASRCARVLRALWSAAPMNDEVIADAKAFIAAGSYDDLTLLWEQEREPIHRHHAQTLRELLPSPQRAGARSRN